MTVHNIQVMEMHPLSCSDRFFIDPRR